MDLGFEPELVMFKVEALLTLLSLQPPDLCVT